jgi:hypothetical protein
MTENSDRMESPRAKHQTNFFLDGPFVRLVRSLDKSWGRWSLELAADTPFVFTPVCVVGRASRGALREFTVFSYFPD